MRSHASLGHRYSRQPPAHQVRRFPKGNDIGKRVCDPVILYIPINLLHAPVRVHPLTSPSHRTSVCLPLRGLRPQWLVIAPLCLHSRVPRARACACCLRPLGMRIDMATSGALRCANSLMRSHIDLNLNVEPGHPVVARTGVQWFSKSP